MTNNLKGKWQSDGSELLNNSLASWNVSYNNSDDDDDEKITNKEENEKNNSNNSLHNLSVQSNKGRPMNILYNLDDINGTNDDDDDDDDDNNINRTIPMKKYYFELTVKEINPIIQDKTKIHTTTTTDSTSSSSSSSNSFSYSISVGIAKINEFKPGYKIRGMFYNGNLTNGGAALKVSYGPGQLKQNDCIGLEYTEEEVQKQQQQQDDNNDNDNIIECIITLVIYLNGKKLGTAFQIPVVSTKQNDNNTNNNNNNVPLFHPCISLQGRFQFHTRIVSNYCESYYNQIDEKIIIPPPPPPFEGKWTIVEAYTKDDDNNNQQYQSYLPSSSSTSNRKIKPTLSLTKKKDDEDNQWDVSIHVCNRLWTSKTILRDTNTVATTATTTTTTTTRYVLQNDPNSSGGHVRSTRMLARSPWNQFERIVSNSLQTTWMLMEFSNDNTILHIKDKEGIIVAKCLKVQPNNEPACTSYSN